jgi:hypothetical protein
MSAFSFGARAAKNTAATACNVKPGDLLQVNVWNLNGTESSIPFRYWRDTIVVL